VRAIKRPDWGEGMVVQTSEHDVLVRFPALAKAHNTRLLHVTEIAVSRPVSGSSAAPQTAEAALTLGPGRGKRVVRPGLCAECRTVANPVWRYSASSRGPVFVCAACRPAVVERSRSGPISL
jgi:hypothetical protein